MQQSGKKRNKFSKNIFLPRRVQVCNLKPDFDSIKALCRLWRPWFIN